VLALGNLASSLVPNYASLLAIRIVMLAIGALYTPQAADTAALIVGAGKRGSTIAYVFLGWSLAAAAGLPLITAVASCYGWQAAYGRIDALGTLSALVLAWRLSSGLSGAPVDLKTWVALGRNRNVLLLLLITTLADVRTVRRVHLYGSAAADADGGRGAPNRAALRRLAHLRLYGVLLASRIVDSWGARRTSVLFMTLVLAGVVGWALSAGIYWLMVGAVAVSGLGFASTNSMQQVRLVAAAPPLAPASVSLNTSVLYIGQAVGSAIGGLLYAHVLFQSLGFVAAALSPWP
jgi:MFS transporter, DHA1 family, inner membrane transport protein